MAQGAVVDLPELSVIIAGTNTWRPTAEDRVFEPRLERFLRVRALYRPPQPGPGKFGGIPSYIFPEWLVCPRCRLLAQFTDFSFRGKQGDFVCTRNTALHGSGPQPVAFPARFMVACAAGHLDDFPWRYWAHGATGNCTGSGLNWPTRAVRDPPATSLSSAPRAETSSQWRTPSAPVLFHDAADGGHGCQLEPMTVDVMRPLRPSCAEPRTPTSRSLQAHCQSHRGRTRSTRTWVRIAILFSRLRAWRSSRRAIEEGFYEAGDLLQRYTVDQLWKALTAEPEAEDDLKRREYVSFIHPEAKSVLKSEFEVSVRDVHARYEDKLELVVAATRLREVRALRGFTRLDSVPDLGERTDVSDLEVTLAGLGPRDIDWLPGIDFRGEGIFLKLSGTALHAWETRSEVARRSKRLAMQFADWRKLRSLDERPFPGMAYVLLHTLAHILMRQLALGLWILLISVAGTNLQSRRRRPNDRSSYLYSEFGFGRLSWRPGRPSRCKSLGPVARRRLAWSNLLRFRPALWWRRNGPDDEPQRCRVPRMSAGR